MIEYQEFIFLLMSPTIPSFQYSIMILLRTYFIDFSLKNVMFFSKTLFPNLTPPPHAGGGWEGG